MTGEIRSFRILCRDFLTRILDLELIWSRGEIERLLVQFAAILGGLSFTFAVVTVLGVVRQQRGRPRGLMARWEFAGAPA